VEKANKISAPHTAIFCSISSLATGGDINEADFLQYSINAFWHRKTPRESRQIFWGSHHDHMGNTVVAS
jgi:hypothetical protein